LACLTNRICVGLSDVLDALPRPVADGVVIAEEHGGCRISTKSMEDLSNPAPARIGIEGLASEQAIHSTERNPMNGLTMDLSLNTSSLLRHAASFHADTPVVSRLADGSFHRSRYAGIAVRAERLANALASKLGVQVGDRVGTLAWNGCRRLELCHGISALGAVTHTINPRLFADQFRYITTHAEDRCIFFDVGFASLVEQLAPICPSVIHWVALCDQDERRGIQQPGVLSYEELLEGQPAAFDWPVLEERRAASLCCTSGTPGNPKGPLFSHRSTLLHCFALAWPDSIALSAREALAPAVPMFHVNDWGLPYARAAVGAAIALPGSQLDGASHDELFESQGATFSGAMLTVWNGLLDYTKERKLRFRTLEKVVIGGSACPPALIRTLQDDYGVPVIHAWGMIELSPLGTTATVKAKDRASSPADRATLQAKLGRPLVVVDMRIVDDWGHVQPRDGPPVGAPQVRRPWVNNGYFWGEGGSPITLDRWFETGDVATFDADGHMQITDRSKGVIKFDGEWISSIDLENLTTAHAAVAEAASIAMPHPKWDKRPMMVVVRKPGASLTREELLDYLQGKVAKCWIPEDVAFVEALPHRAIGKLMKTALRQTVVGHTWPVQPQGDDAAQHTPEAP